MPRIAGLDVPANKRIEIALMYIYGIGKTLSGRILTEAGVDKNIRAKNLSDEQVSLLNTIIDKKYPVEGVLKRQIAQNIQRLKDIGCYRGFRHRRNLPVRGQRTRTNARTRKGPRKGAIAKKKTI